MGLAGWYRMERLMKIDGETKDGSMDQNTEQKHADHEVNKT